MQVVPFCIDYLIELYLFFLSGLDVAASMEESEMQNLGDEQNLGLDNSGPKLPDLASRPPGK